MERANMTHNWVNYMRMIENDIECIIYNAKEGNLEETKRQILYALEKYLLKSMMKNSNIIIGRETVFLFFQR